MWNLPEPGIKPVSCIGILACSVAKSRLTFGTPWTGIFQARILQRVAISSSRGSSWLRNWTWVACISSGFFTTELSGFLSTESWGKSKAVLFSSPTWSMRRGCSEAWSDLPEAAKLVSGAPGSGAQLWLQAWAIDHFHSALDSFPRAPKARWPRTTDTYCLRGVEPRSPRSRPWEGLFFLRGMRRL